MRPTRFVFALLAAAVLALPVHALDRVMHQRFNQGLDNLLAAVDEYEPDAPPLVGYNGNGSVKYFHPRDAGHVPTSSRSAEDAALQFITQHAAAFELYSLNTSFTATRVTNAGQSTYVRLRQAYAGVPVYGAGMTVELDASCGITAVFSDIMSNSYALDTATVPVEPSVSASGAQTAAVQAFSALLDERVAQRRADLEYLEDRGILSAQAAAACLTEALDAELTTTQPSLVIYEPGVVGKEGDPTPAWLLEVRSDPCRLVSRVVVVDAHRGDVVHHY